MDSDVKNAAIVGHDSERTLQLTNSGKIRDIREFTIRIRFLNVKNSARINHGSDLTNEIQSN